MSRSWAGGSTTAWRKVRAYVLGRDGWKCRAHQEGWCARSSAAPHTCTAMAETAHHTHGRAVTGDDPDHLVAACTACNLAIGDPNAKPDPHPKRGTRW